MGLSWTRMTANKDSTILMIMVTYIYD